MDVYSYVASSNPQKSRDIINSFGYKVNNPKDMGGNLRTLVASEGESALKEVLNNHPDKDVILEMFQKKSEPCKVCQERERFQNYLNASGFDVSDAKKTENNFSLVFMSGIMLLAFAIISTKK